jgi:hypothetical protein
LEVADNNFLALPLQLPRDEQSAKKKQKNRDSTEANNENNESTE